MDAEQATTFRRQLMALHRRLRAEHLNQVGLQAILTLGAIDRLGCQAAPGALAADLQMARSNMSAMLRELEAKGWITRRASDDDRRRRTVALTPSGRAVLERDRAGRETWLRRAVTEELTRDEREVLLAAGVLMQRLADSDATAQTS